MPRRRAAVLDDPGPTPETRRHLRPDPVLVLWHRGRLTPRQASAAFSVREIVERVAGRYVRSSAGRLGLLGTRVQFSPHPLDGVPAWLQARYRDRYVPWAAAMGRIRCGLGNLLELVFAVVVDGLSLRQLEERYRIGRRRATMLLGMALERF